MKHVIESAKKLVWHDLTEDPNDLPEDNHEYFVLERDLKTGELDPHFCYECYHMGWFNKEDKLWRMTDDDGYGSYNVATIKSYGVDVPRDAEVTMDWEVVAWAEDQSPEIPTYTPALYLKGE